MRYASLGWDEIFRLGYSLVLAYVIALPVGWERKEHSHARVGLRVFPLISVAACAYVFLGQQLFIGADGAEQAHVLHGLMVGIGFVGAGAIMKGSNDVHGVSTAASVWTTGAIGAAVAFGFFGLAIALGVLNLTILYVIDRIWRHEHGEDDDEEDDDEDEDVGR